MPGEARLNWALIRAKTADIRQNLVVLRDYAGQADEVFLGNNEAIRSARYAFIVAIEAALNLCSHLCARLLAATPESYADCFFHLARGGFLESELAERLAAMARFRNLLVHGYGDVDDTRMLEIMRTRLVDLDAFVRAVARNLPDDGEAGDV